MDNPQALLTQEAALLVSTGAGLGMTVGFAESCTAGLCCASVGSISGASSVLAGGVVSYQIPVKESVLGVSPAILDNPQLGAVSAECALQMAEGARGLLHADVVVSVTGIAGPLGEEPGKPVGTVWFAVAGSDGNSTNLQLFNGDRDEVRVQAALFALRLAREALMKASTPK